MPPADDEVLLDHAEFLRSLARALLGDPDRASDVVQDTWARALERPPRHAKSLRGWLAVVARNFARRAVRADRRRAERERRAASPEGLPSAHDVAARIELQRKVVEAVGALEEPYRSTLLLRYFDGLDPAEIARRAGLPVGTVKTRLSRALEKVRARLGERGTWAPFLLPLVLRDTVATAPSGAVATGVLLTMKKAIAILLLLVAGLVVLWRESREPAETGRAAGSTAARERAGSEAAPEARAEEAAAPAAESRSQSAGPFVFEGRVVDAEGVGVRGARVRLVYAHTGDAGDPMGRIGDRIRREAERREGPETATDADGYFRFARPYPSHSYLVASAEGCAEAVSGEHVPGKPVTITLLAASEVLVRVVDPEGKPVAGARVRLVARGAAIEVRRMLQPREILHGAETDERGEARLPLLPAAGLRIEVDPRESDLGFVSCPVQKKETVVVAPRVKCNEWRIVDAETGAPVPGAYVIVGEETSYWNWSMELERRRIFANAGGRVRVPWQEGLVAFYASAPGYEQALAVGDTIRLSRAMCVRGFVVDRSGAPLAAVPVFVTCSGGWDSVAHGLPLVAAWTDAEGRFEFDMKVVTPRLVVPDRGLRSVLAIHDGLAAVQDGLVVEPGRTVDLRLEMPRPAALEVELVDTEGNPLPDKRIFVTRQIPRAASWPEVGRAPLLDMAGRDVPQTDAAGVALVDRLPPGNYQVSFDTLEAEVRLEEGETKRLRLVQGAGPRITGVLLDADGKPLADKHVGLSGPSASGRKTDAQGRFAFVDLEPGEYTVSYDMQFGMQFARLGVTARPGDDVVLRVPAAPARLELTVEGPPPESVRYSFVTKSGSIVPDGAEMSRLDGPSPEFLPGEGLLVARADGFGWTAVRFEAAAGRTTPVHVVLPRSGAVRAKLSEPPAGQQISVRLKRDDGLPESVTGGDSMLGYGVRRVAGAWGYQEPLGEEITDVAPGTYRAAAGYYAGRGADSWTEIAAARVEVASAKTVEVELTPLR